MLLFLILLIGCSLAQQQIHFALHSGEPVSHSHQHLAFEEKQRLVKEAFQFAWNGYREFSWGFDESKPVTNGSRTTRNGWGATIVDALDTLYVMGLMDEFEEAKSFVAKIDWSNTTDNAQVFETVIRYVGGLLGAYDLSEDKLFVDKAVELADRLLPAFDTPTGIPYQFVNFTSNKAIKSGFHNGVSCLAEVGSVQLELTRLSQITGNWKYHDAGKKVYEAFKKAEEEPVGLYPEFIDADTGKLIGETITWGGMADSFYEYLIKQYISSGKKDELMKNMTMKAVRGLEKHLLSTSKNHPETLYIADLVKGKQKPVMQELACFAPGTLLLAARHIPELTDVDVISSRLMDSCFNAWASTRTGLAPESFSWTDTQGRHGGGNITERQKDLDTKHGMYPISQSYILRPETIESLFYFHRLKPEGSKYQDMAWQIFSAINTHCRTNSGFSGVTDVDALKPIFDDRQESFFFAETLKYLYLIFDTSEKQLLPLDEWVFNTEAHPLRITGQLPNKPSVTDILMD